MTRFGLSAVIGSVRQMLAVVIALLAIAGAVYLVSHKLSNPDHYAYGSCFHGPFGSRSPKTNRAPRTRSRLSGDFFWVPPRKLTLVLGAGPTRMAAPSVP